jgi:hypothetical protein
MANVTIATLMSRSRQRADMENNNFVQDAELVDYINAGIAELHDILIQEYGQDYYVSSKDFNTTADKDTYPINDSTSTENINISDFYKLRGMDAKINGNDFFTLYPFNFNERNLYQNWGSWSLLGLTNIRYRMVGGSIVFTPTPDTATAVKVWYIPQAAQFSSGTDTDTKWDDINGYAEYVIVFAAIRMLQKEESDVQVLLAQQGDLRKRITDAAANRDADNPLTVSDIYTANNRFWFSRSTS